MNNIVSTLRLGVSIAATVLLGVTQLKAQSDDFESGTLGPEWKRSNFNPALVSTTFPNIGTGRALRVQANPFPPQAPAAAMFYQEQIYTNFYLAADLVDWPGTDKNQAIVMVARGTLSANPATTTGVIFNYDTSQYGENPTDRRQGQLQINLVTNSPAFGTKTLAVAEITFQPGRSYRMVFKGEGPDYTGMVYDHADLTRPLVTIRANDVEQGNQPGGGSIFFEDGFKSGMSGFLIFSRQGTSGTGDATLDNYYAGPSDPNPASGTALAHPVAGTPAVESRTPAERFKNFHNPAEGLSFTVKTHNDNLIDTAATKLRLNGNDVSSQLVLPANGTSATITLPGSALAANTVYSAQLEVQDASGTRKSTNTFWFDTFSEAYLGSANVKVIEAEHYNFDGGQFKPNPSPSGYDSLGNGVNDDNGYLELVGVEGVDFHDNRASAENPWFTEFRSADPVGLSAGIYPEISDFVEPSAEAIRRSDTVRQSHASRGLLEYIVHRTEAGEWLNYTRNFEAGTYLPYLRVASFGAADVELRQVTSDRTQPEQTTSLLGTFKVPNMIARYNYRYIPLVNEQGQPATVTLPAGANTLRLEMTGTGQDQRKLAINYLMLVPQAAAPAVKLFATDTITGQFAEVTNATVDAQAQTISLPITGNARFLRVNAGTTMRITRAQVSGNTLTLSYQAAN